MDNLEKVDNQQIDDNLEGKETEFAEDNKEEEKCPECGKPKDECTCKEEDKKEYCLDEIPEYQDLMTQYSELEQKYNALVEEKNALEEEIQPLAEFKKQAERKEKEEMIASFYMLTDEDKADVIANIDTYSLGDIEAKLSIICVRNKVSFNLEEEDDMPGATTFNLEDTQDESVPAWVKAALKTAKNM